MEKIILKMPEATYCRQEGISGQEHFVIDCACGVMNGSHLKKIDDVAEKLSRKYVPLEKAQQTKHTFYMNEAIFISYILRHHRRSPVIIVCNHCKREFSFTEKSHLELMCKIENEGQTVKLQNSSN